MLPSRLIPGRPLGFSCAPRCTVQEGSKAIMHLEAFVAKFMADYKAFMLTAFG